MVKTKSFQTTLQFVLIATLILRLFFAYEWGSAGFDKISNIISNPQQYISAIHTTLGNWAKNNPYTFMASFLQGFVVPNVALVVSLVAIAELTLGICYLFGFLVRPVAIIGMFLNSIFFLAAGQTSVSTAGINFIMFGGQLFMFLVSAGRAYGLDALLSKKFHKL